VSVETGTRENLTIVDGLTAPPDKPAAAAQPGASGQWQKLQPAGPPPAPPEAHIEGVSASNDLWIGAGRLPRSSHLTRSGGLYPALARQACRGLTADSPAELTRTTFRSTQRLSTGKSSVSKGKLSSVGQAHSWPPHAGSNGNRPPVSLPRAWRNGMGTHPIYCASAGRAVGQAVLSVLAKNPRSPLPPGGRGSAALRSSRQAITAPGGREHIEHERRS
jgi:hypothetical protein